MENIDKLVPLTRRIVPETCFGVRDVVNLNGQMFFVYDFQFDGVRRQILLPLTVMAEMKSFAERYAA